MVLMNAENQNPRQSLITVATGISIMKHTAFLMNLTHWLLGFPAVDIEEGLSPPTPLLAKILKALRAEKSSGAHLIKKSGSATDFLPKMATGHYTCLRLALFLHEIAVKRSKTSLEDWPKHSLLTKIVWVFIWVWTKDKLWRYTISGFSPFFSHFSFSFSRSFLMFFFLLPLFPMEKFPPKRKCQW